jgi:hypothetical protein
MTTKLKKKRKNMKKEKKKRRKNMNLIDGRRLSRFLMDMLYLKLVMVINNLITNNFKEAKVIVYSKLLPRP